MKIGVVCVSDRCAKGVCEDVSGKLMLELLAPVAEETLYRLVPDERLEIEFALCDLADDQHADVILTTGGTGFAPRDVTPEATNAVIDRAAPGISEAIRMKSLTVTPNAMLSRAVSGIRGKTLIVNLPGSPKAVRESLEVVLPVLPHAVETLSGNTQNCGGNYGK
jgi:molybdenum cofactor synthesis domain-containing protein